jgi:O-antigen/teichoic acid export membrane protein
MPAALVAFRVAGAVSGMVLAMILTTSLGAAKFGEIAQALSLAMTLSLICTLGLESACPKFLIGNLKHAAFGQARSFIYFNFGVLLTTSTVLCFLAFMWSKNYSTLIFLAIFAAPVVALTRMAAGFSMGFSNVYAAVIPRSFLRPFLFLSFVTLYAIHSETLSSDRILFGFIGINLIVFCIQMFFFAPHITRLRNDADGQSLSFLNWKKWMGFGGIVGGAVIFIEFFQHLSILIASVILPAADIAYLDICMKLVGFITFGVVAVNQSFLPRNAHAFFDFDMAKLQSLLRQAALIRCGTSVVGMIVIYAAGPLILSLFGSEFSVALPVLNVLIWLPLLIAFFGPAANMLSITDQPVILLKIVVAALLVLSIGILWGSQNLGVVGAAYGVLLSWVVWGALVAHHTWRRVGVDTTFIAIFVDHSKNTAQHGSAT